MPEPPPRFTVIARRFLAAVVSNIGNALQKQSEAISEATQARHTESNVPPKVQAEVNLPLGVETRKSKKDAADDNKYQRYSLLVSSLTLIAIMIYALLVFYQLQEMVATTGATRDAVHEARLSRQQSQKSLTATIEQFRLDQRAWVGVGGITAHPESLHVGDNAIINFSFKNTGKTPARNMLVTLVKDPVTKGMTPKFSYRGEKPARYGMLPPNGDNFASLSIANSISTKEPRPLNAAILNQLVSGKTVFYIHGQLSYQDVFDNQHWTTFCYFLLNPDAVVTFGACPEHNDAGDGQIPKYQPPKVPSEWPPAN